jgi:hypothetical protein
VSVLVRVVRQFREAAEAITLEKVLVLPDVPTMGARLDLRAEGVEDALTVAGVTLRAIPDGLGLRPPSVDVLLFFPPLGTAPLGCVRSPGIDVSPKRIGGRACPTRHRLARLSGHLTASRP